MPTEKISAMPKHPDATTPLAVALRQQMNARQMNLVQAAAACGVSHSVMHNWLVKGRTPTALHRAELAAFLDVTAEELAEMLTPTPRQPADNLRGIRDELHRMNDTLRDIRDELRGA